MAQFIIQSNFQFGEISDLLHAQVTSGIYYKAARRLRNALVIPQGGARKRFGTSFMATITGETNYLQVRVVVFAVDDVDKYVLIFKHLELLIYHDNALVATIVTTYDRTQIEELDWASANNQLIVTQDSHSPAVLTRTSAHAGWDWNESPTFVHKPTFEFDKNYDAFTFKVKDSGTTNDIVVADNLLGAEVDLWSSSAIFTAQHDGALFFGDGGILRLESRVAGFETTRIKSRIIQVFDNDSSLFHSKGGTANSILGADAVLTQIVFSSVNGWPKKVAFYQNRLFFANTRKLPHGLWGSNYNGYGFDSATTDTEFLFNDAFSLDTSAISTLLSGSETILITELLSFVSLVITTNIGVYSTTLEAFSPITPTSVAFINRQSGEATSQNISSVIFDTQIMFANKGGRKINALNLSSTTLSYDVSNISVLAPQVVGTPFDLGVYENGSVDGRWLFVTNTANDLAGTLAIYQNVPEQQITAWTLADTLNGLFRQVDSKDDFVYFLVERTIDGNTLLQVEYLDFDVYTDSTTTYTGTSTTTITGLSHLEGETVQVVGDGAVMEEKTVSSGSITLERAVTTAQVGLGYTTLIRPMPLNVQFESGPNVYLPKTIKSVFVDFFESTQIYVNGTLLRPFTFDVDNYDTAPTLKTDFAQVEPMGGWDPKQNIDITSSKPVPMTIIGIGYVVDA